MKNLKYIVYLIAVTALITCSESESMSPSTDSGSGTGGSMARFTIAGNYLYTVDEWDLNAYNISNTADPVFTGKVQIGFGIETIFPKGDKLFIGSERGMYIYDISNPANPVKLSNYQHIFSCDPVVVEGNYAYVTLHSEGSRCGRNTNELQIVDITNPYDPLFAISYPMSNPLGLGIDSTTLFVCDKGLKVFDAQNIYDLNIIHHFDIQAYDVIPLNGLLLVTGRDGLYQYSYENDTIYFLSKVGVTPPV